MRLVSLHSPDQVRAPVLIASAGQFLLSAVGFQASACSAEPPELATQGRLAAGSSWHAWLQRLSRGVRVGSFAPWVRARGSGAAGHAAKHACQTGGVFGVKNGDFWDLIAGATMVEAAYLAKSRQPDAPMALSSFARPLQVTRRALSSRLPPRTAKGWWPGGSQRSVSARMSRLCGKHLQGHWREPGCSWGDCPPPSHASQGLADRTPADVLRFIKQMQNRFSGLGAGTTFVELLRLIPSIEQGWARRAESAGTQEREWDEADGDLAEETTPTGASEDSPAAFMC